jgi:hypothetical protein
VDLERGGGALEGDLVAGHLQRILAVDAQVEGLAAQPLDRPGERPVAGEVGHRRALEVRGGEGRQDADHRDPPVVERRRAPHLAHRVVDLRRQGGEGTAGERRRSQVALHVEAIELHGEARVGALAEDGAVAGQGIAALVDQAELDLGPERARTLAKARPLHQLAQRHQAALQALHEGGKLRLLEALPIDREAHLGGLPAGGARLPAFAPPGEPAGPPGRAARASRLRWLVVTLWRRAEPACSPSGRGASLPAHPGALRALRACCGGWSSRC